MRTRKSKILLVKNFLKDYYISFPKFCLNAGRKRAISYKFVSINFDVECFCGRKSKNLSNEFIRLLVKFLSICL